MRKATALLIVPLAAQLLGCSYSYPIWATMVGGRLAFESGDRAYDCFTNIRVAARGPMVPDPAIDAIADPLKKGEAMERARAAWATDHVQTYECKADFPVVYGAPQPASATVVPAKPLRMGVPYEVSTFGPKGAGGHGCFRINPDGRPENLADQDCPYAGETAPPTAAVAAPAVASAPPIETTSRRSRQPVPPSGGMAANSPPPRGGMMIANSTSGQVVAVSGSAPIGAQPINATPPADQTGPSQMYALTPYRGIERYLRDYPSLAACERARAAMSKEQAERRLCGLGPKSPAF
jgi:hypothetical protein